MFLVSEIEAVTLARILQRVRLIDEKTGILDGTTKHSEVGGFDAAIDNSPPQYEYEGTQRAVTTRTASSGRIWGSTTASTSTTTPASPSSRKERAEERQRQSS